MGMQVCMCKIIAKTSIMSLARFPYNLGKGEQVISQWVKFGERYFELLSYIDLKIL